MTSQSIELHIQELVLHGFDNLDSYYVRAAVQQELARLFTEQGVPPSLTNGGQAGNQSGLTFDAAPGSGANEIGNQVAQALYRGFSQ